MALLWAAIGLIVGPLLNVLIDRLPRSGRESRLTICPRCGANRSVLAWWALLSHLLGGRGRCRGCGAGPERLELAVELATGIAFGLLFLRFGASPRLLLYSLYTCILVVVFFIDWQHRLILDRVTLPGMALSLLLTPSVTAVGLDMALVGLLAGGALFGILYAVGYLMFKQEALGMGDVKLAMLLGAMAGFPQLLWWFWLGSIVGGLVAAAKMAAMAVTRRGSPREYMPYGTALCLGSFVALLIDFPSP